MTKKVISIENLKETLERQKAYKARNEEITVARRESIEADKLFPLGRNAR